jgi:hypothetical protein
METAITDQNGWYGRQYKSQKREIQDSGISAWKQWRHHNNRQFLCTFLYMQLILYILL